MIEDISRIAADFFFNNDKNKITILNKYKIKISPSCLYNILITYNNENNITITPKWKFGLIGSLLFHKQYIALREIIKELEKKYSENNYKISKLHTFTVYK